MAIDMCATLLALLVCAIVQYVTLVTFYVQSMRSSMARTFEIETKCARMEDRFMQEYRGRKRAEGNLRDLLQKRLNTTRGAFIQPIGQIRSCFSHCVGTPRQGQLAPATRGRIDFENNICPHSLDGLENFDYIWIIFIFHLNTNGKESLNHAGVAKSKNKKTFQAKISPPMLKSKVGIFSTRSPHRPNPLGITLAKVERIQKRTVHISGIDLVDGTPVIDIKPYVPGPDKPNSSWTYDSFPDARVPCWISQTVPVRRPVTFTRKAEDKLHNHQRGLKYFDNALEAKMAIQQVLSVDVRSARLTDRGRQQTSSMPFDSLVIHFVVGVVDGARKEDTVHDGEDSRIYDVPLKSAVNSSVGSDDTAAKSNSENRSEALYAPMREIVTVVDVTRQRT